MSERKNRARRGLLAAVAVLFVAWLVVIVAWGEAPFALTFDDAWYYFGIARNVAAGHGSTFDQINATNGYHPLWLGLSVPVYWLGLNGLAAARTLLVVQLVLWAGAMSLVADLVGRAIDNWPRITDHDGRAARWCTLTTVGAFALFAGNPFVVKTFVNGLESGVVVLLYAALLAIAAHGSSRWVEGTSHRWRLGVGVLLAVTFLGRTDAIILVGLLGLWCLAEAWPSGFGAVVPLLELFGPVAATVAIYLTANQAAFDTPVQVSGLIKRAPLDARHLLPFLALALVALAIGVATFRRNQRGAVKKGARFARLGAFVRRTGWFAAFDVVLIGYYNFLQTQQWLWYYCPVVLYLLVLLVLGVADFAESAVVEAPADRSLARTLAPIQAILLAPLVVAFVIQYRSFTDPHLRSIQLANRDAGEWIDANLPDDAVLASWDAGVVGYFSKRRVMNLDGVVNSYEYYRAGKDGTVPEFLQSRGLGYVVNHGTPVDGEDPSIDSFVRTNFGAEAASSTRLVETWPFLYDGVTTGAAGTDSGGLRRLEVFLYRLPSPPAPAS